MHRDDKDPETNLTLPAEDNSNGTKMWFKNDEFHRDDKDPVTGLTLPAVIWYNGMQEYYKYGMEFIP
jgi:hypothetical protein